MSIIFGIILHILLLGSLVLFASVLLIGAWHTQDPTERLFRIMAIFAGALVSLGATASGVNYATYTVNALAQGRSVSAAAHFFTVFIPALTGVGIGFFLVRTIRKSSVLALRILGFVGMLATTAFIEVYAQAATVSGFKLGATALPNIGFTAGVILTVVFTYKTGQPQGGGTTARLMSQLLQRGTGPASGPGSAARTSAPHLAPGQHLASGQHFTPGQHLNPGQRPDDNQYRGL